MQFLSVFLYESRSQLFLVVGATLWIDHDKLVFNRLWRRIVRQDVEGENSVAVIFVMSSSNSARLVNSSAVVHFSLPLIYLQKHVSADVDMAASAHARIKVSVAGKTVPVTSGVFRISERGANPLAPSPFPPLFSLSLPSPPFPSSSFPSP